MSDKLQALIAAGERMRESIEVGQTYVTIWDAAGVQAWDLAWQDYTNERARNAESPATSADSSTSSRTRL
jgi:hypothetical protein